MPSLGMITLNALTAADSVIIPVQAQYLPAKGMTQLLSTIAKVKKHTNPNLAIDGILLTLVDGRTNLAKSTVEALRENFGCRIRIYRTTIPVAVKAAEVSSKGKSIYAYAPFEAERFQSLPPDLAEKYREKFKYPERFIKRDIGDSVALCQCVAQELGHAQLAMNCEAYSRRDMGFSAVCVGYMLCRKFGVDVKNFAIDRIPEELAGKSPKEIRAELSKTRSAMSEIGSRVSEEIYRRRADRSKDQER